MDSLGTWNWTGMVPGASGGAMPGPPGPPGPPGGNWPGGMPGTAMP